MTQSSVTSCNASLLARNSLLDGGKVEIRAGSQQDIDDPISGTLLETINLKNPAFQAPVNRAAQANIPNTINASSNASVGSKHYVAYNKDGGVERIGTVGTSNADIILSKDSWSVGEPLTVTSWVTSEAK